MSRNRSNCFLALLVLAALLTGPGWASPQSRRAPGPTHAQPTLWSWFIQALLKEGCTLDPNGRLCPARSSARPEAGCTLDPGGCGPTRHLLDNGCTLDPNGRCVK
jgi:hypothetical protein